MNVNAEVTPEARDYLVSLLAKQEVPGMAARVYVEKGGTQHAETCLAFCPPGEESREDVRKDFDDLTLYFEAASVPYLQEMEIGLHGEGNLYRLSPEVTKQLGFQSDAMRLVYDSEIPVNVVSLGLIYELDIDQNSHCVRVEMTLTSPGCGIGDIIAGDLKDKLLQVPHVEDCRVDVVFDPPWSYDSLDEEARLELGLI